MFYLFVYLFYTILLRTIVVGILGAPDLAPRDLGDFTGCPVLSELGEAGLAVAEAGKYHVEHVPCSRKHIHRIYSIR